MPTTKINPTEDIDRLELAKLLWDEYKYRHEVCWNLIIRLTLAGASLAIIPYLDEKIIDLRKHWVIFTPLIGLILSILGALRLNREMVLLDKIRREHRQFQFEYYQLEMGKGQSTFRSHVNRYMWAFLALQLTNCVIIFTGS